MLVTHLTLALAMANAPTMSVANTAMGPQLAALNTRTSGDSKDLAPERAPAKRSGKTPKMRRHGFGLLSGLSMVPKGYLKGSMAAYTLPRCGSKGPSDKEKDSGLIRAENCSWYAGIQYIYRRSEHLDLVATAEYRKFKFPDGYWLKHKDWDSECNGDSDDGEHCDLGMADFAEVDFSHVYLGAEAVGYANLWKKNRWLVQLGGGGGVGLVIFTGKRVLQTPIGRNSDGRPDSADGDNCDTIQDFDDFTKCQPQWWDDPDVNQDGKGDRDDDRLKNEKLIEQDGYVDCDENSCDYDDLEAIGSRVQGFKPPVLALPKLVASARVLFDQSYGLNLRGGFNGGLFMGASLQYFFGKAK